MAEREGFEPPIDLRLCLISSQVHSTGLCHLSALFYFISGQRVAASGTECIAPQFILKLTRTAKSAVGPRSDASWRPANGLPSFSYGCVSRSHRPASTPQA